MDFDPLEDESQIDPMEEYRVQDASGFDLNAKAGWPLWLDDNTLRFIFSVRYNSVAFTNSYLQENYRRETHQEFSSLIVDLIQQKLETMRRMPWLYENKKAKALRKLDDESSENVLELADELGIKAEDIDVISVVEDVISSLEKILTDLIKQRPGMNPAEKKEAIKFLDDQLWDTDTQLKWRGVSARMLAKMYQYEALPTTVTIILQLNDYVNAEMETGSLQGQDIRNAYIESLLSDDTIERIYNALRDKDPDEDESVTIAEAILDDSDSDDDDGIDYDAYGY